MAKLKDGFYKQTASSIGSDLLVLLAGGGAKPISDFALADGTNATGTWSINISGKSEKVTCSEATSDTNRPIVVTNKSNGLYYSAKATLNYSTGNITATTFTGTLTNTLTFSAGTFTAKTYNNSAAVTVNIPTKTSHLTNDSNFFAVTAISKNTDINTLKGTTLYYIDTDGNAGTLTNSPYTKSFAMLQLKGYESGDDLRRYRLAINGQGDAKLFNDRDTANTGGAWVDILTSKNSGISGNGGNTWGSSVTIKINGIEKTLTIPANPNTDSKVTQTNTTGNASYRVLFSVTADDTTRTEGARKSGKLLFNPSSGLLTAGGFVKSGSSNSYVLLGGGGHKAIGNASGNIALSNGTTCTNLNADLLDGVHASGLFTNLSNSGNNISITIGGTNKTLIPAYATSAGTASSANWLNVNNTLTYGASGLNYFNINGTAGNTKANNTPTSAWYHIIRMNHSNSGGYLADIAVPLNDVGGVWWRQIRNGGFYGWYKILDTNNYTSYCAPASHSHAYYPLSGNTYMSGDNVWIGSTMGGGTDYWRIGGSGTSDNGVCQITIGDNSNDYFQIVIADYTGTNYTALQVKAGGTYAPHFYESSDQRLKTNIQTILNKDNIPQIKEFDWKESGEHSYGLIAQELEEQGYSELVSTKDDGYKTVNYSAALSLIVGKLQVKIKELEKEIENLKNKN